MSAPLSGLLRIGAFSRRVGVSVSVLRAWEARYGLFTPRRTEGGFRLYSPEDESRARRMLTLLERGLAPRESAAAVLAGPGPAGGSPADAWAAYDAEGAHRLLDGLLAGPHPELAVSRAVLPGLCAAAGGWSDAQCQFASRQLEARLLALGERWHEAPGPLALVGCAPEEQHTLGAIAFALALHARGWRIAYLGPDVPVASYAAAARALQPELIAISCTLGWALARASGELAALAREFRVALGGPAAGEDAAGVRGATWLAGDPAAAAARV